MIRVLIPSPLFSYTGGQRQVEAEGESLAGMLQALDSRFPGMRHRLDRALGSGDEVMIVAALSGG